MLTTDKLFQSPEFGPKFEAWSSAVVRRDFHQRGFNDMLRDRAGDYEDQAGYDVFDTLGIYEGRPDDIKDFLSEWLKPEEIAIYTETIPEAILRSGDAADAIESLGKSVGLHSFALSGLNKAFGQAPINPRAMRMIMMYRETALQSAAEKLHEHRGQAFVLDYFGYITAGRINDDMAQAVGDSYDTFVIPSEPGIARSYLRNENEDVPIPSEKCVIPVHCIMENTFHVGDAAELIADPVKRERRAILHADIFFGKIPEGPVDVTSLVRVGGEVMLPNIEYQNHIVQTARDIARDYVKVSV